MIKATKDLILQYIQTDEYSDKYWGGKLTITKLNSFQDLGLIKCNDGRMVERIRVDFDFDDNGSTINYSAAFDSEDFHKFMVGKRDDRFSELLGMSWEDFLKNEKKKDYFKEIESFLESQDRDNIFPPKGQVFNAFNQTPFENIKVIIIGQDPYHGSGQANGLAFSVNEGVKIPPSLRNIFKEIKNEFGYDMDKGDLTSWANQGVFLLNTILTVEKSKPESHKDIGWNTFTDNCIKWVSENKENLVFMLWGNHAKSKESLIGDNHLILKSTHPSPFSAYRGFLGCDHFKKCNEYLEGKNLKPIDWKII
ncbi:MAG: uracil-DNA glycosylase [uncultured marine phage]|uniref:uracil-DNA glycosylase n=1 Tax=uncultured marine phage TaxID=707152 RepID=A0A8D9FQ49_9VIRU|nr:MAG: uracil-DNA glycosylase [uncultured marine phage]